MLEKQEDFERENQENQESLIVGNENQTKTLNNDILGDSQNTGTLISNGVQDGGSTTNNNECRKMKFSEKEEKRIKKYEEKVVALKAYDFWSIGRKFTPVEIAFKNFHSQYNTRKPVKKDIDLNLKKDLLMACHQYIGNRAGNKAKAEGIIGMKNREENLYEKECRDTYAFRKYSGGDWEKNDKKKGKHKFGGDKRKFKIGFCLDIIDFLTNENYFDDRSTSDRRVKKLLKKHSNKGLQYSTDSNSKKEGGNMSDITFMVKNSDQSIRRIYRERKKDKTEKFLEDQLGKIFYYDGINDTINFVEDYTSTLKSKDLEARKSSVLYYLTAELLCGSDQTLVPETRLAQINNQSQGLFMHEAEGTQASQLYIAKSKEQNPDITITPSAIAQANVLGIFDNIFLNRDGHAGNYFFQMDKNGTITGITGIDNDENVAGMCTDCLLNNMADIENHIIEEAKKKVMVNYKGEKTTFEGLLKAEQGRIIKPFSDEGVSKRFSKAIEQYLTIKYENLFYKNEEIVDKDKGDKYNDYFISKYLMKNIDSVDERAQREYNGVNQLNFNNMMTLPFTKELIEEKKKAKGGDYNAEKLERPLILEKNFYEKMIASDTYIKFEKLVKTAYGEHPLVEILTKNFKDMADYLRNLREDEKKIKFVSEVEDEIKEEKKAINLLDSKNKNYLSGFASLMVCHFYYVKYRVSEDEWEKNRKAKGGKNNTINEKFKKEFEENVKSMF